MCPYPSIGIGRPFAAPWRSSWQWLAVFVVVPLWLTSACVPDVAAQPASGDATTESAPSDPNSDQQEVPLTEAERRWIAEHPVIRVGVDPEFHPFEFIDGDGAYRGIAADYLALIGPRLGLTFEVARDLSWSQAVERAEAGQLDMLPAVGRTRERERYLLFSDPYVEYQRVIVTRTDMPFLQGLADLEGLRVAVQTSSSHEGFLREHSTIEPIGCPTLEACVRAVSSGEVDALVGNVASLAHWIRRLNLTNLKVAGAASDEVHTLHMATRADWPVLAAIVQKGLDSVTTPEREAIAERWVVLQYEPAVDRRSMWRVLIAASIAVAFLAAWIVLIRRQTARVKHARDEAVAAEARARDANAELEELRRGLEEQVEERTRELVDAERRFQAAQKMEALGTLVGGIAHDFNNLLQGMLGAIFLVEEDLTDPIHKKYLRDAAALGKRGADLIRQLLAVARKGSGSKTQVDLRALLRELAPVLRTTLPPTIEFEHVESPDPVSVFGNAALLQQVVLNLVNNARDAVIGQTNGHVRLVVRPVAEGDPTPEALAPGPYAVIEVEDNGPGIPDDIVDRIFDPFFTTKPSGQGTGLGLAMAFGAVQDHGGAIDVRTAPGAGTTFRVFLPLEDRSAAADAGADTDVTRGAGETLLLADDEPTVLANHAAILTRLGYRVLTAVDGEEAVAAVRDHAEIRLVVLDVLMPILDGVAAAREIRGHRPELPVIFLSAYDPEGDLPERLRPKGELALRKPITPQELSRVVARVLRGE